MSKKKKAPVEKKESVKDTSPAELENSPGKEEDAAVPAEPEKVLLKEPGKDEEPVYVPFREKKQKLDENGEPVTDEKGEPVMEETGRILKLGKDGFPETGDDGEPVYADPEAKKSFIGAAAEKAANFLGHFGIPDMALPRFLAAYFLVSGYNSHVLRTDENIRAVSAWREYIEHIDGKITALLIFGIFILLTGIYAVLPKKMKIADPLLGIGATLFFAVETVWRTADFNLSMGVTLISCVFIAYCAGKLGRKTLFRKMPAWLCFIISMAVGTLVCIFIAVTTVLRHRTFCSSCFDFGIFVQMYHSLTSNLTAVTTCERDKVLSHFFIHSSYIYYALVPVMKLFPSEDTLLVSQAVLSMGGVIPAFLIARRHNMRGLTLIFMCAAYSFCTGLIGPCYYEFHENAFLPTLLMWLLWAIDGRKTVMIYIMSVLVCIVKEDAPLYVVCILMYYFFANKGSRKRFHGIIISALSLVYMVFITNWLTKHGDGQMMTSTRFGLLMIDYNGGLGEVAKNVLMDPGYFFSTFITHRASIDNGNLNHKDTLTFFLEVMLPMLGIPFFTKKVHRFLLMLPFVIMNLVIGTGYGYAADIGFQYILGPSVLLLYLCIINLDDMGASKKRILPIAMGSAAMIMSFGLFSGHAGYIDTYKNNQAYYDDLDAMLKSVPEDARVSTEHYLLPHMAYRDVIYCIKTEDVHAEEGYIDNADKYDCYVFGNGDVANAFKPILDRDYVLYDQLDGRVWIYMTHEYYDRAIAGKK